MRPCPNQDAIRLTLDNVPDPVAHVLDRSGCSLPRQDLLQAGLVLGMGMGMGMGIGFGSGLVLGLVLGSELGLGLGLGLGLDNIFDMLSQGSNPKASDSG